MGPGKPAETAVIVCDVWDAHHCLNAVRRVKEMAVTSLAHLLVQVALEIVAAARRRDASQAQHMDAIRHAHDAAHVVVDEEDSHAGERELLDPAEHLLGEDRG